MNRVLIGESCINSLPSYFDCSSEPMLRVVADKPDEGKIRERYAHLKDYLE